MFLPLHDNTTLKVIRFQMVSGAIILINFALFFYTELINGGVDANSLATSFGAVPALLTNDKVLPEALVRIPEIGTLITYMFLHAGWIHILIQHGFCLGFRR